MWLLLCSGTRGCSGELNFCRIALNVLAMLPPALISYICEKQSQRSEEKSDFTAKVHGIQLPGRGNTQREEEPEGHKKTFISPIASLPSKGL